MRQSIVPLEYLDTEMILWDKQTSTKSQGKGGLWHS